MIEKTRRRMAELSHKDKINKWLTHPNGLLHLICKVFKRTEQYLWSTHFRRLGSDVAQKLCTLAQNTREEKREDDHLSAPSKDRRHQRKRVVCSAPNDNIWGQRAASQTDTRWRFPCYVRQHCVEEAQKTVGNYFFLPRLSNTDVRVILHSV